ncbi:MAG: SRPBCC family protein [Candidatus Promineifilaceae bacterium]
MPPKSSDTLTLTLPSERETRMTRVFDAPRALVFQAYTDPAIIPHWWGLRGSTTIVDKMDVQPGGQWRYVERHPDGTEYGFHGEYREIVPPERLVSTFEFEGMPGHVVVDTAIFEELPDGKTRLTITSLFASREDRDGMMASGMETGAGETWDRLAEFLAQKV